jgi:hypothetical protein
MRVSKGGVSGYFSVYFVFVIFKIVSIYGLVYGV